MAKVKKTHQELLNVVRAINVLANNKEHSDANTKGVKKLTKIGEKMKSHLEAYNDKLDDIRLEHANTDKDGSLLLDENGGYKYTKEQLKELNKKVKVLLAEEFEFYQFTFSTEGLEKYGFLDGFVEGLEFPELAGTEDDEDTAEAQVVEMV
jgi:predicted nuclease with TOPRIM domain